MMEVDQREVQRLGGRAWRYPSSYIVHRLLATHGLERVLDLTYGRGRFYAYSRPRRLVGADPVRWPWVVEPDVFLQSDIFEVEPYLLALGGGFDVLVLDPPFYHPGVRYRKRAEYSYIIGSPEGIIGQGIKIARRMGIGYLLLHFDRLLELPVVENIGFRYMARYLNNGGLRTTYYTLYRV